MEKVGIELNNVFIEKKVEKCKSEEKRVSIENKPNWSGFKYARADPVHESYT